MEILEDEGGHRRCQSFMKSVIRTLFLTLVISITLYTALVPLRFPEYLLSSGQARVKVEALRGIPEQCNANLLMRHRSSTPDPMAMAFCGTIMTDHGLFTLPESRFFLFGQSRQDIYEKLGVGCVYDVTYYGYRATVYRGMPLTNRFIPKLISANGPIGNCN
jgi:hypothetical protein